MPRELLDVERAIMELLLSEDFPGRHELRAQLATARVAAWSCACGCDSVALTVPRTAAPAPVLGRVPAEAIGNDERGVPVGVLIHVVDGYLAELEFFSLDDVDSFGRPTLGSLALATRD